MSQVQRRKFLVATGALLAAPLARAQQAGKVRRVVVLVTNLGGRRPYFEETKDGLRERGWIEGKNIAYDVRSAEGNTDLFRKRWCGAWTASWTKSRRSSARRDMRCSHRHVTHGQWRNGSGRRRPHSGHSRF